MVTGPGLGGEGLRFKTVLVVDDNEGVLRAFANSQKGTGVRLFTASNCALARRLVREHAPELVVLDVMLGCESGIDLIPELKSPPSPPVVVMMTGYKCIARAVAAIKLGADDFVTKPIRLHEIVDRLRGGPSCPEEYEPMTLDEVKREHALRVFAECDGNLSLAASRLGVTRPTLRRLLEASPCLDIDE